MTPPYEQKTLPKDDGGDTRKRMSPINAHAVSRLPGSILAKQCVDANGFRISQAH